MRCLKEPWETPHRQWQAAHVLTYREASVYKSYLCTLSFQSDFLFLILKCEWTATSQNLRHLRKACDLSFSLCSPPNLATPSSFRH